MNAFFKPFNELSLTELYALMKLRSAVFIVEQQCIYQDFDDKDQNAVHLLLKQGDEIVAYARILPDIEEKYLSFGRILTSPQYRRRGLGKQLIQLLMQYIKDNYKNYRIHINAQSYLEHFYQGYGFVTHGEAFDLDGIPHVHMSYQRE